MLDVATYWYVANYSLQPSHMWLCENGKVIHDPGIRVENVCMATIQVTTNLHYYRGTRQIILLIHAGRNFWGGHMDNKVLAELWTRRYLCKGSVALERISVHVTPKSNSVPLLL